MAISVEDICNQALRRIGFETLIGSMYEGSRAARVGLDIYGQTRDDQMQLIKPSFSRRDVVLVLLKTAPVGGYTVIPWSPIYPPLPWIYEYGYPADCLEMAVVRPPAKALPRFMPRPNVFRLAHDGDLNLQVILSNAANAVATYTGQVNDVTAWDTTFTEAMVGALARRFAQAFGMADIAKAEVGEEQSDDRNAMKNMG